MFKNKLKSIIGDGNDGNNKKKIENFNMSKNKMWPVKLRKS